MTKMLVDRIPFAKIVTILAIVAAVSVGLCGVGAIFVQFSNRPGLEGTLAILPLMIGGVAFWLSVVGLVLVCVVWAVLSLIASFTRSDL